MASTFGRGAPPAALAPYTGFLLNWIAAGSRERFTEAMGELDLDPQQFALMNVIEGEPGAAQNDLVGALHIDPSTMVAMIDRLEERELAERRPHPSDRRKRAVYLTEGGEALLRKARGAARKVGEETFAALDEDERAEFARLVGKVAGARSGHSGS